MDSYRPDQQYDERNEDDRHGDDVPQDYGTGRIHDRSHGRTRDYDRAPDRAYDRARDYDNRGSRYHDSRRQGYQYDGGYRDSDHDDRGGRLYHSDERMNYDDDDGAYRRNNRDRSGRQRFASHREYGMFDDMRYYAERGPPSTGEKDKSNDNTSNKFLLIQHLKPTTTGALLAKDLEKLYRGADEQLGGATPCSLRRVMMVRERDSNIKMSFAFAEYYTTDDAVAARKKAEQLAAEDEDDFEATSQQFQVDHPHTGVFASASIPGKYGPTKEEFIFLMDGRKQKYHDERYYLDCEMVNWDPPLSQQDPSETATTKAASAQTGSKRGIDTLEKQQSKPKKAKKTTAGPSVLSMWKEKGAELREPETELSNSISEPQTTDEQTFAVDTGSEPACYLCNTKFSAPETLHRHLRESETHAAYIQDEDRKYKAVQRLKKKGFDFENDTVKLPALPPASVPAPSAPSDADAALPAWRDRAAERRGAEAPSQPAAKVSFSLKPSSSPVPAPNKAKGMLQKMGWKEGEGLGEGGRVAPVETEMFAAGVGLGHEGSRRGDAVVEAERRTKDEGGGGTGFLEATREAARKRFDAMQ